MFQRKINVERKEQNIALNKSDCRNVLSFALKKNLKQIILIHMIICEKKIILTLGQQVYIFIKLSHLSYDFKSKTCLKRVQLISNWMNGNMYWFIIFSCQYQLNIVWMFKFDYFKKFIF